MFYSLNGKIIYTNIQTNILVIECGGVGFKCITTQNTLYKLKDKTEATVFTHLNVREDALDLFCFAENEELNCFKTLISVSGVGPKAAISILSELSPEKFALAIATDDYKEITKAQGVGIKIAQRIVLELKDKMKKLGFTITQKALDENNQNEIQFSSDKVISETVSALVVLGYNQTEAIKAANEGYMKNPLASVEDLIKHSLKKLARY